MSAAEETRLQALHSFQLLDTPPEPALDEAARRAAQICRSRFGFVSLVDRDRQFFKARFGLDAVEAPRPGSFCVQAIRQREVFQVPDALLDARFAEGPVVAGTPHLRFYAGVPLVAAEGLAIGTLCAADQKPRSLTPEQRELLELLGQQVMLRLELRRSEALRVLTARALDEVLRARLEQVQRSAARAMPSRSAAQVLLHSQRAADLAAELAALRPAPPALSRAPVDLAALLGGVLEALEAPVRVAGRGDCTGAWDADLLSQALALLCEEALSRGPLTAAVAGAAHEVTIELGGAAAGLGEIGAWLTGDEGGPARAVSRRLAQRIVLAHGGSIRASGRALLIALPRS